LVATPVNSCYNKDMKDIQNEAETGVQTITNLQMTLAQIENELQTNPKFIEFLRVQDELNAKRSEFDSTMKDLMIERFKDTGEKKLEVGNATFALTPREELIITDEDKVEDAFVTKVTVKKLDKEAVKAVQVLEGRLVDGVGVRQSFAYKLTIKDNE